MQTAVDLKQLRVAVTGGTSGLGLALVRHLVARGARVAFIARTARTVEQIANEIGACGIVGDVGRKEDIYPVALQVLGNLGGLDALINNASALGPTPLALLADTECEELEQALAVNLLGPFRLTKALLGALGASARSHRGAVVINISSDAAVTPYSEWGAYGASKAALHGQPIQYAHVKEPLVDKNRGGSDRAFEPPSAGFALDWKIQASWRQHGVGFATLTHAAGISSTGDPTLDLRLPFNEPYRIPDQTASAIAHAKLNHRRVIAIGTTVTRALESAASPDGGVRAGNGVATGRLTRGTPVRVANAILTGVHQPGESHFELLRAFADDAALNQISAELSAYNYRNHEFGDSILVECRPSLFSERNSNVRCSSA